MAIESGYERLRADYAKTCQLRFTNDTGSEIAGGAVRVEGDTLGVVLDPTPDTEDGVLIFRVPSPGVKLPMKTGTGENASPGGVLYWDKSAGKFTTTSADGSAAARVLKAVENADATVVVELTNEEPIA